MDFHVILIESGRPTHHWRFNDLDVAIIQLKRLNDAFQECNEVYATLIKAGYDQRSYMPDQLIQSMTVPPRSE